MARIKLKHVNTFVCSDGRVRHYFRRGRGAKAIALPGLPGSEEFMAAYGAALAAVPNNDVAEIGASTTSPGLVNALVVTYYKSSAWAALEEDTRKMRWRIIEHFRAEHGDKRVALLREEHLKSMLAKIGRPSAQRQWLRTIRGLLRAAIPSMRRDDPTAGIAGIKMPKTKGHHCWTDVEVEQYRARWPLGTQQRLVMEFALETASRKGEVIRLGPQHVQNGRIRIERTHGSRDVNILISPRTASGDRRHAEGASHIHRQCLRQAAFEIRTWHRLCEMGNCGRAAEALPHAWTEEGRYASPRRGQCDHA